MAARRRACARGHAPRRGAACSAAASCCCALRRCCTAPPTPTSPPPPPHPLPTRPTPAGAVHPAMAAVQQQSEFAKKASQIGLAIHKTSLKLQKLAQLAKRTSMFDDPSAEIDELTGIIKHDIQALNEGIADLQRVSARRGGDANKQSAEHSHTVVDSLRTRLKDATAEFKEVRGGGVERQGRLMAADFGLARLEAGAAGRLPWVCASRRQPGAASGAPLAAALTACAPPPRQVLTLRTDNLKTHNERRQLFSNQPDSSSGCPRGVGMSVRGRQAAARCQQRSGCCAAVGGSRASACPRPSRPCARRRPPRPRPCRLPRAHAAAGPRGQRRAHRVEPVWRPARQRRRRADADGAAAAGRLPQQPGGGAAERGGHHRGARQHIHAAGGDGAGGGEGGGERA
jgi:hypothetical protein